MSDQAAELTEAEREAITEAATTGWRPGEEVDPLIAAVAQVKAEAARAERERIAVALYEIANRAVCLWDKRPIERLAESLARGEGR